VHGLALYLCEHLNSKPKFNLASVIWLHSNIISKCLAVIVRLSGFRFVFS
jgi:hypothetical protein